MDLANSLNKAALEERERVVLQPSTLEALQEGPALMSGFPRFLPNGKSDGQIYLPFGRWRGSEECVGFAWLDRSLEEVACWSLVSGFRRLGLYRLSMTRVGSGFTREREGRKRRSGTQLQIPDTRYQMQDSSCGWIALVAFSAIILQFLHQRCGAWSHCMTTVAAVRRASTVRPKCQIACSMN